ncbi:DUF6549 family protein [Flavobacterium litorale]|uniref:Uncharacterized protein n=1 Tax=Flavobacterium litorale TaxID=2856519 RepID=A0ABX8V7W9_9FLAO|nr:DUF6549 family protein [Flavobacterium litorale]QYJ68943.1 hypothetical protein K1I41_03395 [Flavobacterium litorale]
MKHYLPYAVSIALAILLLHQCQKYNHNTTIANQNQAALTDSLKHYQNKLGTTTASIKTLQATHKKQLSALLGKDREIEKLKQEFANIKTVVKYKTVTQFDTIKVFFEQPIREYDFVRAGKVNHKHYSFSYSADNVGFTLEDLTIPNKVTIITGVKRKWFLGKQYITTDVTNSNPYVTVTNLKAAEVQIPQPWYKKWYVWLAAGFVTSTVIAN